MSELEFLRLIKQSLRSAQEDAPAVRPVADLVGGRILEIERATVPQKAVAPGIALDDRVVFKEYLRECDDCAIVPNISNAFNFAWQRATCAQALPFGWKLVPVEPTREMLDAYVAADGRFHSGRSDWAAMLAAAPQPSAAQQEPALSIELTDDVRFILGFICFQCMHIVQALRLGGREINTKAEDEQAAAIHFMLNHYLADRENWRENVNAELRAMAAKGQEGSAR